MMLMAVALLALLWAGASEVRADSPTPLFVHAYPVDTPTGYPWWSRFSGAAGRTPRPPYNAA